MIHNFKDIAGKRFGKLLVLNRAPNKIPCKTLWNVLCDCGTRKTVPSANLRSGQVKSCGCSRYEKITLHGGAADHRKTREYSAWLGMRYRCEDSRLKCYKNYGGRGIKVCERWQSFPVFLSDMGCCPTGCSLDRVDNNGNYEPENCRWATRKQQNRNRRGNRLIEINGVSKPLVDWTEQQGLDYMLVHARLFKLGWTPERALQFS